MKTRCSIVICRDWKWSRTEMQLLGMNHQVERKKYWERKPSREDAVSPFSPWFMDLY